MSVSVLNKVPSFDGNRYWDVVFFPYELFAFTIDSSIVKKLYPKSAGQYVVKMQYVTGSLPHPLVGSTGSGRLVDRRSGV